MNHLLDEISVEHQQAASTEVLEVLREWDYEATVAGGAPRNWKEGKLANDIDCYLRSYASLSRHKIASFLNTFLPEEVEMLTCKDTSKYGYTVDCGFSIKRIIDFKYKGVIFQLIFLKEETPIESLRAAVVGHMDVGLNKISWEGVNRGYYETPEYKKDFKNKTLTLYTIGTSESQIAHSLKVHLPKMIGYYPDYELKI